MSFRAELPEPHSFRGYVPISGDRNVLYITTNEKLGDETRHYFLRYEITPEGLTETVLWTD